MRRPITDVMFTEVLVRVSYRLVQLHVRRAAPGELVHPPALVYALAEHYRATGFTNLYWTLNQCARWLARGYTMIAWRDELQPYQHARAFHKRRGNAPRS